MNETTRWAWATVNVGADGPSQDRVAVWPTDDGRCVVVLADGAGGMAGGAEAAQAVLDSLGARVAKLRAGPRAAACATALREVDRTLARSGGGQSTAVVVVVGATGAWGASVGDSGAWWLVGSSVHDLTAGQRRKPMVGSGVATPVVFAHAEPRGTLLVASDGLFNYVAFDRIAPTALSAPPDVAVRALVDAARLRTGALRDDVAVAPALRGQL